jgi:hypothetical protein
MKLWARCGAPPPRLKDGGDGATTPSEQGTSYGRVLSGLWMRRAEACTYRPTPITDYELGTRSPTTQPIVHVLGWDVFRSHLLFTGPI